MYKAFHNLLPPIIQTTFVLCSDVHSYSTRHANQFYPQQTRTTQKSLSLSSTGVKLWRDMPEILKLCRSYFILKRNYKNELLLQYSIE